jgi:hypothetical protein
MDDIASPHLVSGWGRTIFSSPRIVISAASVFEEISSVRGQSPLGILGPMAIQHLIQMAFLYPLSRSSRLLFLRILT